MLIEAFGFISVSAMVLFYSLEARSPVYVLACLLLSLANAPHENLSEFAALACASSSPVESGIENKALRPDPSCGVAAECRAVRRREEDARGQEERRSQPAQTGTAFTHARAGVGAPCWAGSGGRVSAVSTISRAEV
jgi:hypothetical protein